MSQPPRVRSTATDPAQWIREAANILNGLPWRFTPVKVGNYTAAYGELVLCDPTGGAFAVTLPKARDGAKIGIKNNSASANHITVTAGAGDTVDGAATLVMNTARQAVTLYADSTQWRAL